MKKVDTLMLKVSQIKDKYSNSCSVSIDIHDYELDNEFTKLVTIKINIFDNRDNYIKHTAYYQCIPNIIEYTFKKFQIGHFVMVYYEDDNPEKNEMMDIYTGFMDSLVKKHNIIKYVGV